MYTVRCTKQSLESPPPRRVSLFGPSRVCNRGQQGTVATRTVSSVVSSWLQPPRMPLKCIARKHATVTTHRTPGTPARAILFGEPSRAAGLGRPRITHCAGLREYSKNSNTWVD